MRLVVPGSRGPQGNPREDPRSLDDGTPAGAGLRLVAPTAAGVDGSLESLAGTRATAEYPGSPEGPRREAVATDIYPFSTKDLADYHYSISSS